MGKSWNVTLVGDEKLKIALEGYKQSFSIKGRAVRRLMTLLGRAGRDSVRNRITKQGSTKSWQGLGKWTRARTGRRKALITERPRIKFNTGVGIAQVYYETRSDKWNLTQHHKGFTNPSQSRGATIRLKDPRPLGVTGNFIRIRQAKAGIVPARNVWGTEIENRAMAGRIVTAWAASFLDHTHLFVFPGRGR